MSEALMKLVIKYAVRVIAAVLVVFVAFGAFTTAKNFGWLSLVGIASERHDTQVIHAIERTQEVSLLSLGIQGITQESRSRTVLGKQVPGTTETVFLQYNFNGKLGIDGEDVTVTEIGPDEYLISVPEFIFIGYDEPTFKVAVEDGGVLDWVTPDIDKVEMVNKILNDDARKTYIASNTDLLQEQTKVFYDSLIKSIDQEIVIEYEFWDGKSVAP